jgi:ADP-ribosyl-[dinitrogen reductase] hydrolase
MVVRTSHSHPLRIDAVTVPGGGRIGMTFCPGKRQAEAMTGSWERDLGIDLDAVVAWGASTLVTLVEPHELVDLGVPDLGMRTLERQLAWFHLPIRDRDVPCERFERDWETVGPELQASLDRGDAIVLHCMGGLGRTGLVACRLLIERGESPAGALARVRGARPGAVETAGQEAYLRDGSFGRRERAKAMD